MFLLSERRGGDGESRRRRGGDRESLSPLSVGGPGEGRGAECGSENRRPSREKKIGKR